MSNKNEHKHQESQETDQEQDQIIPESYEVDVSQLVSLIPKTMAGHAWIQRGPHLICTSCALEHGSWIGMNKRLMGIDENGSPILKTIVFKKIGTG